jgi:transposase
MEKYQKESLSKWHNQYGEEFKRHVCNEFLTGTLTRNAVEQKYGLGKSHVTHWLKEMGYDYKQPRLVSLPTMSQNTSSSRESQADVNKLKKELEDAKLLAEAYRKMIEHAEREFKISILKKSNTE